MIEVYLFLAAFTVQILAISALIPARFIHRIRTELTKVPAERLAQVYPGIDVGQAYERFLDRYRAANIIVAVLGFLLLGWFFRYMRQPGWDEGGISGFIGAYFLLQNLPLILIAWFVTRFNKVYGRSAPEARRKASLQRRGLFDFVSPWLAVLAVLSFAQYAALVFYIQQHPFPGFGGAFANIGILTLMYVLFASVMYWMMYGRKKAPLETQANRLQITRAVLNCYAWMCILVPLFLSFALARKLLELETWVPFGRSVSFLLLSLLILRMRSWSTAPRQPGTGLDSSPAH